MSLPAALTSLARRAAVAQVGGFRPPDDGLSSSMGNEVPLELAPLWRGVTA